MRVLRRLWSRILYSDDPHRVAFQLIEPVPRHGWNVHYDQVFLAELSREGWLTAEELGDSVHAKRVWFGPSPERVTEWLESAQRRRLVEDREGPTREWATTERGDDVASGIKLSAVLPIVGLFVSVAALAAGPLDADTWTVVAVLALVLAIGGNAILGERLLWAPTARAAWDAERRSRDGGGEGQTSDGGG